MDIKSAPLPSLPHERLKRLPKGWALAVVDGSCHGAEKNSPGDLFVGGVLFDRAGNELQRFCRPAGQGYSTDAEYQAIQVALRLAARLGVAGLEVHTDSEVIAKAVGRERIPTYRRPTLQARHQSVRDLMNRIACGCRVRFVGRERVTPAHTLAKLAQQTGATV